VESAIGNIGRAYQLLPSMPGIKPAELKNIHVFGDLVFDNFVSDMIMRRKVRVFAETNRTQLYRYADRKFGPR
jgi:hypothetical protein